MYIICIEYQELIPFHQAAHLICTLKGITATGKAVDCYWAWPRICSRETANRDK